MWSKRKKKKNKRINDSKRQNYITGMYFKSYWWKGIISIPKAWVNYDIPYVYCAKILDKRNNVTHLAFYDTPKRFSRDLGLIEVAEKDIEILELSKHRRLPFTRLITLPKSFYKEKADVFERQLRFVGAVNRFEVWKEDEFADIEREMFMSGSMFDFDMNIGF